MTEARSPARGAGPLYPQTPAGLAAAEEPVRIPRPDDAAPADGPPDERQAVKASDDGKDV
jgi:hypothetical protein